ncbi:Bro-N domain-containing protein [Rhodomicrobium sp.]|uniref:BRO-N domain-containing protein n=1 Tax=Rhodomicrobium sp. TaxID=2720632 RepID=UPI0039E72901
MSTTNTPQLFNFENNTVRVLERDGEPWFVLAYVCRVLELRSDNVSRSLASDEKNTHYITGGNRGNPNVTIVNESGLYSIIMTSRKESARRFKKWVTSEVLPMIRKTGMYVEKGKLEDMLSDPRKLRHLDAAQFSIFHTARVMTLCCGLAELGEHAPPKFGGQRLRRCG